MALPLGSNLTLDPGQEVGHTEPQPPQRLSGVVTLPPVVLEKSVTEEPAKPQMVPGMHARLLGEPELGSERATHWSKQLQSSSERL